MLDDLNAYGWRDIFDNPLVLSMGITRESVAEIVAIAVPDHETTDACELFCSDGYLGLFRLQDGRFAAIQANCDTTETPCSQMCMLGEDREELLREAFNMPQRDRLGIPTPEDEVFNAMVTCTDDG
jgi:hypothetical protein